MGATFVLAWLHRKQHMRTDLGDGICSEPAFQAYNISGPDCADFCGENKTFAEKIETAFGKIIKPDRDTRGI